MMKPTSETNKETWTKQQWGGNPELKLICSCKLFTSYDRIVPVWIFGGTKKYPAFHFCVNAGANSDLSYTGYCVGCLTLSDSENYVDNLYSKKKLFT